MIISRSSALISFYLQDRVEAQWLRAALARTENFYKKGPREPATWILTVGKDLPPGAFVGGTFGADQPAYVARGFVDVSFPCRMIIIHPTNVGLQNSLRKSKH